MKQILIADDDDMVAKLIELYLRSQKFDFNYFHARNGLEALNIFTCMPIDLVILDHQMPLMSGLQALSRMRAVKKSTPIYMTSGSCSFCKNLECLDFGATSILAKPITAAALLAIVKKVFGHAPSSHHKMMTSDAFINQ